MNGWQPYTNGRNVVYAIQFWPSDRIWPECVIPWGVNEGRTPRDESWGYVETPAGRVHINAGDWIVKSVEVVEADFHRQYKAVKDE